MNTVYQSATSTFYSKWFFAVAVIVMACIGFFCTADVVLAVTSSDSFPKNPVSVRVSEIQAVNDAEKMNTIAPTNDGTYVVYRDRFVGFQPARTLMGYYNKKVVIEFSGQTLPEALVTLSLDAPTVRTHAAYADKTGQWSVSIDASKLPAGNYNATMRASLDDAVSDTQVVGTFAVYTQNKLSNMTWIAIIIAGLGIIMLLTIVNGVMLFRRG